MLAWTQIALAGHRPTESFLTAEELTARRFLGPTQPGVARTQRAVIDTHPDDTARVDDRRDLCMGPRPDEQGFDLLRSVMLEPNDASCAGPGRSVSSEQRGSCRGRLEVRWFRFATLWRSDKTTITNIAGRDD